MKDILHRFVSASALLAVLAACAARADDTVLVINQAANDLVYDSINQVLYASIPSRVGANGNTITAIDPVSGDNYGYAFVGSEPRKLALADDSSYLYVGLDGSAAARRFDLVNGVVDIQFALGSDFLGPFYVDDMKVMPGAPHTVAISRRNKGFSPRHQGVGIYDDGVARPKTTPTHTGSNVIAFSDDPARLYGYNNETTDFGLRRMAVDESGVTVLDSTGNLFSGFGVDIRYDSGLLYSTNGKVVDPEARQLHGTYSNIGFDSLVAPDSGLGKVFFLTGNTLAAYDMYTFVPIGSTRLTGYTGTPASLVRWGTDGVAFLTTSDQLVIVRSSLVSE